MKTASEEQKRLIDAAIPNTAPAKPAKPRRLLVTSLNVRKGEVRDGHRSIGPGNYALLRLGEETGAFETVFDDDPGRFHPDRISEFDGVCFNNTVGVLTDDDTLRNGLLDFVGNGGGFIGLHAAGATFCEFPVYDQFPAFGKMLGGYENGGHPWKADDTIILTPEDAESPLNAPFGGEDFEIQDEVFQFKDHYSRENMRVLLRIDTDKTDTGPDRKILPERRADMDLAISWIKPYGKGRVFYSSLGHNDTIFWNSPVLGHLLAGIQYALGDLKADDSPRPKPA